MAIIKLPWYIVHLNVLEVLERRLESLKQNSNYDQIYVPHIKSQSVFLTYINNSSS